jgi:ABC-2 type transport system permease protein
MFGGVFIASRTEGLEEARDKKIVIVDGTGGTLATAFHQVVVAQSVTAAGMGGDTGSNYMIDRHPDAEINDDERLALSERVRNEEMEAFVEIPADVLEQGGAAGASSTVKFYAQNAVLSPARGWFERVLNETVTTHRLNALNLDVAAVKQATAHINVAPLGLVKKSADGTIRGADEGRSMLAIFLPFGFMMLMFMVIFMSAQPLLESVMEEKSGRIGEVLLGSVNATQLMLGKLLGNVAGSMTVVAIYAAGAYIAARYNAWTDLMPLEVAPWFLVYQVLAVLLFSSIFMAVGAAVTQLKEVQTLLLPVWLLLATPMFVWLPIVRQPNGTIAKWMSFFPPATPLVMVLRLASDAVIPAWQIAATLLLLVATTGVGVFAAGRIFRIGMLWQGKSPRITELARWAFRG